MKRQKRHYCTYCGCKRNEDQMVLVEYKLLRKQAWHCKEHMSTLADITIIREGGEKPVLVELFSGSGHIASTARSRGYEAVTLDNNPQFGADIQTNILQVKRKQFPERVDVVWASVPCTYFSIMNLGASRTGKKHWERVSLGYRNYLYVPLTNEARSALLILNKTLSLINQLRPAFFFIENPRGGMRHMQQMKAIPFRSTVSYFDYGFDYFKPTDIFHNCRFFHPKPCSYQNAQSFDQRCTDLSSAYERSLIPPALIDDFLDSLPFGLPGSVGDFSLDNLRAEELEGW